MIRWIFFDLDGVLVNSRQWHFEALDSALRQVGIEITKEEHDKEFDGLPTRTKLQMMSSRYSLAPDQMEQIEEAKKKITCKILLERIKVDPKLKSLLSLIKSYDVKMAVCSNARRETVETCLKKLEIEEYFEFYLSNEDVKNPKPSPEIYQKAIEKAGVPESDILIIEDILHGVRAASQTSCFLEKISNADELSLQIVSPYLEL
jgi:beta-phosphoglucomutase